VIEARGYWTATDWTDLDGLGFKSTQKHAGRFPALMIPQYGPDGEYVYTVMRPDRPRINAKGKAIKYEQPAAYGLRLDVPLPCLQRLRDPDWDLWWTEGAKKVDALASRGLVAVNTPGVDGWRSPNAIPDLFGIPLKDRRVICAYDSDVLTKPAVRLSVIALAHWMSQKGALVDLLDWSRIEVPEGGKMGVDDYLAR
jgi:hypothetical protein